MPEPSPSLDARLRQMARDQTARQKRDTDEDSEWFYGQVLLAMRHAASEAIAEPSPSLREAIAQARERVLWRELKRDKGVLSPEQSEWAVALQDAGADYDTWRPGDWDRIVAELRRRG